MFVLLGCISSRTRRLAAAAISSGYRWLHGRQQPALVFHALPCRARAKSSSAELRRGWRSWLPVDVDADGDAAPDRAVPASAVPCRGRCISSRARWIHAAGASARGDGPSRNRVANGEGAGRRPLKRRRVGGKPTTTGAGQARREPTAGWSVVASGAPTAGVNARRRR